MLSDHLECEIADTLEFKHLSCIDRYIGTLLIGSLWMVCVVKLIVQFIVSHP